MDKELPREVRMAIFILLKFAIDQGLPILDGEITKGGKTYQVNLSVEEVKS